MARRVRALAGLILLALSVRALAAETPAPDPAPTAELLLFLAEFEDAAGNEVDPIELAEQTEPARDAKPSAATKREPKGAPDDDEPPPPQ